MNETNFINLNTDYFYDLPTNFRLPLKEEQMKETNFINLNTDYSYDLPTNFPLPLKVEHN